MAGTPPITPHRRRPGRPIKVTDKMVKDTADEPLRHAAAKLGLSRTRLWARRQALIEGRASLTDRA
jgi:hypothetical protein